MLSLIDVGVSLAKWIGQHGQETIADVYKSMRPEELATLAPQHHCDMLDYVSSMVGILCSCKPALCWFMNEFWNISPKVHRFLKGTLSESSLKDSDIELTTFIFCVFWA